MNRQTSRFLRGCRTILAIIPSASSPILHAEGYLHDPKIDEAVHDSKGPFNYFLTPSDALGFMDSPKGVQFTGDGAYNAPWSELTLWAGTPLKQLNSRVRTLDDGCLPIFNYGSLIDDVEYRVKSFAAPVGLDPLGNLLTFVRITATNPGAEPVRAAIGARVFDHEGAWRYPLRGDEGFPTWWTNRFIDEKRWEPWKLWEETEFRNGAVHRTGCKHLIFAHKPDASGWQVIEAPANVEPVEFVITLKPGQSASVDLTMPYAPVADEREKEVAAVTAARFDDYLEKTRGFWRGMLGSAATFEVPEEKVMDMHRSSLMYDLMARDLAADGKTHIQTVSKVQYNKFFSRDAAFIIHTYDMLGMPHVARECIEHVLLKDDQEKITGLLATHPDAWGQALWTLAAHYRITGDLDFARRVYDAVPGHVDKLEQEIAKDPWGLWPVAGPYDNERIDGHYTGHSFWVLRGLMDAVELAEAVGANEDITRFQKVHDGYRERFMKRLKDITEKTGGYIPPGLDDPLAGMDWENASGGVYPFGVIRADDPMVRNTVSTVRDYAYQEGIMTYEHNAFKVKTMKQSEGIDWSKPQHTVLHHYETFQVLETLLSLGMDREVITDLYSFLVHTGSTNTGFEFDVWAWRDRNFHNNYPPHGWCATRYNELLRNMLLREDVSQPILHLASALSPEWLRPGTAIRVSKAPTDFGRVSYTIETKNEGATVQLEGAWRKSPDRIHFHIPWFLELRSATADGQPIQIKQGALELNPGTRRLELSWNRKSNPDLSYRRGVELYVDRYWKIQRGEKIPGFDSRWIFPK